MPLGAGFDIMKRGYSRTQVEEHLERLDAELRLLAADRDAAASQSADLARQLEIARTEIDDLRSQVDRLMLPPTTLEGLSERLQRMLRLAQDEATETKARAETDAATIRTKAEADANALRRRYDELIADLDKRRANMEAEHRGVLEKAKVEAEAITRKADEDRARLDAEAEQRRGQVDDDFEIAMATRRTEAMRALAEQEAISKSEAERRMRESTQEVNRRRHESITEANARLKEATDEANRRVAEATEEANRRVREATEESNRRISHAAQRVASLRQLRTRIAGQLRDATTLIHDADVLLRNAAPSLDPLADEHEQPPSQGQSQAGPQGQDEQGTSHTNGGESTRKLRPVAKPDGADAAQTTQS